MSLLHYLYAALSAAIPLLTIFRQSSLVQWTRALTSSVLPKFLLPPSDAGSSLATISSGPPDIAQDLDSSLSSLTLVDQLFDLSETQGHPLFQTLEMLWEALVPTVDISILWLHVYMPLILASFLFVYGVSFARRSLFGHNKPGLHGPLISYETQSLASHRITSVAESLELIDKMGGSFDLSSTAESDVVDQDLPRVVISLAPESMDDTPAQFSNELSGDLPSNLTSQDSAINLPAPLLRVEKEQVIPTKSEGVENLPEPRDICPPEPCSGEAEEFSDSDLSDIVFADASESVMALGEDDISPLDLCHGHAPTQSEEGLGSSVAAENQVAISVNPLAPSINASVIVEGALPIIIETTNPNPAPPAEEIEPFSELDALHTHNDYDQEASPSTPALVIDEQPQSDVDNATPLLPMDCKTIDALVVSERPSPTLNDSTVPGEVTLPMVDEATNAKVENAEPSLVPELETQDPVVIEAEVMVTSTLMDNVTLPIEETPSVDGDVHTILSSEPLVEETVELVSPSVSNYDVCVYGGPHKFDMQNISLLPSVELTMDSSSNFGPLDEEEDLSDFIAFLNASSPILAVTRGSNGRSNFVLDPLLQTPALSSCDVTLERISEIPTTGSHALELFSALRDAVESSPRLSECLSDSVSDFALFDILEFSPSPTPITEDRFVHLSPKIKDGACIQLWNDTTSEIGESSESEVEDIKTGLELDANFPLMRTDTRVTAVIGENISDYDWTLANLEMDKQGKFVGPLPISEPPSSEFTLPSDESSRTLAEDASAADAKITEEQPSEDNTMVVFSRHSRSDFELHQVRSVRIESTSPTDPEGLGLLVMQLGLIRHDRAYHMFEPFAELMRAIQGERVALALASIPRPKYFAGPIPLYPFGLTRAEFLGIVPQHRNTFIGTSYAEITRRNLPLPPPIDDEPVAKVQVEIQPPHRPDVVTTINRNRGGQEAAVVALSQIELDRQKAALADTRPLPRISRSRSRSSSISHSRPSTIVHDVRTRCVSLDTGSGAAKPVLPPSNLTRRASSASLSSRAEQFRLRNACSQDTLRKGLESTSRKDTLSTSASSNTRNHSRRASEGSGYARGPFLVERVKATRQQDQDQSALRNQRRPSEGENVPQNHVGHSTPLSRHHQRQNSGSIVCPQSETTPRDINSPRRRSPSVESSHRSPSVNPTLQHYRGRRASLQHLPLDTIMQSPPNSPPSVINKPRCVSAFASLGAAVEGFKYPSVSKYSSSSRDFARIDDDVNVDEAAVDREEDRRDRKRQRTASFIANYQGPVISISDINRAAQSSSHGSVRQRHWVP